MSMTLQGSGPDGGRGPTGVGARQGSGPVGILNAFHMLSYAIISCLFPVISSQVPFPFISCHFL